MVLKVIGAGFGRTGTHSLKLALEMLGFGPCHHMYEVRQSAEQMALWTLASQGAKMDWEKVFAGYSSQVDWPAAYFWEELAMYFPGSKVILSYRDPEEWYNSIVNTILPAAEIGRTHDPDPMGRAGSDLSFNIVLRNVFKGRLLDKKFALEIYSNHLARVKSVVPAHRLLSYDVTEGWNPLCDFLQVECPDKEFPSGNSTADFRAKKSYLKNQAAIKTDF